ncbi:hypothetical protein JKP88DRAFT_242605 [Tribonema minus]|uniref:RING-type domain-containing protein n=1 Tax=Tribonema minus TaxID=303371 RepID=A0A835ZE07_9STRA|nr:hypothetical protein JKP88DRAFT_242605 [Tribonema minus]
MSDMYGGIQVRQAACLLSFERFVGARGGARVCPLCRHANYRKRVSKRGAEAWRQKCLLKMQCVARGYLARQSFRALLREHFRGGGGDARRRRTFMACELSSCTRKLEKSLRSTDDDIEALFGELEQGLAYSRGVFGPPAAPAGAESPTAAAAADTLAELAPHNKPPQPDWGLILSTAQGRGDTECPICMNDMCLDAVGKAGAAAAAKAVAVCSCTHAFHQHCLRAFEAFNIYEVPLCPVCVDRREIEASCSEAAAARQQSSPPELQGRNRHVTALKYDMSWVTGDHCRDKPGRPAPQQSHRQDEKPRHGSGVAIDDDGGWPPPSHETNAAAWGGVAPTDSSPEAWPTPASTGSVPAVAGGTGGGGAERGSAVSYAEKCSISSRGSKSNDFKAEDTLLGPTPSGKSGIRIGGSKQQAKQAPAVQLEALTQKTQQNLELEKQNLQLEKQQPKQAMAVQQAPPLAQQQQIQTAQQEPLRKAALQKKTSSKKRRNQKPSTPQEQEERQEGSSAQQQSSSGGAQDDSAAGSAALGSSSSALLDTADGSARQESVSSMQQQSSSSSAHVESHSLAAQDVSGSAGYAQPAHLQSAEPEPPQGDVVGGSAAADNTAGTATPLTSGTANAPAHGSDAVGHAGGATGGSGAGGNVATTETTARGARKGSRAGGSFATTEAASRGARKGSGEGGDVTKTEAVARSARKGSAAGVDIATTEAAARGARKNSVEVSDVAATKAEMRGARKTSGAGIEIVTTEAAARDDRKGHAAGGDVATTEAAASPAGGSRASSRSSGRGKSKDSASEAAAEASGAAVGGNGRDAAEAAQGAPSESCSSAQYLCPTDMFGKFMGPAGKTLRRLQRLTGCYMGIVERRGGVSPEPRIINFIGTPSAVAAARYFINRVLAGAELPSEDADDATAAVVLRRALCPAEKAAVLIGNYGMGIKRLEHWHAVAINLEHSADPQIMQVTIKGKAADVEHTITFIKAAAFVYYEKISIKGKAADVEHTVRVIEAARGGTQQGDTENQGSRVFDVPANGAAIRLAGRGGEVMEYIQDVTSARLQLQRESAGRDTYLLRISGAPAQIDAATNLVARLFIKGLPPAEGPTTPVRDPPAAAAAAGAAAAGMQALRTPTPRNLRFVTSRCTVIT